MKSTCEKRQNCSFIVNDHTFGESCSTTNSRCTVLDYVYACGSKYYNINYIAKTSIRYSFLFSNDMNYKSWNMWVNIM